MLDTYRVSLSEAQDWVGATQKRLAAAEKNLLKTAQKLAGFSGTAG
jgi:hypothetical protein